MSFAAVAKDICYKDGEGFQNMRCYSERDALELVTDFISYINSIDLRFRITETEDKIIIEVKEY